MADVEPDNHSELRSRVIAAFRRSYAPGFLVPFLELDDGFYLVDIDDPTLQDSDREGRLEVFVYEGVRTARLTYTHTFPEGTYLEPVHHFYVSLGGRVGISHGLFDYFPDEYQYDVPLDFFLDESNLEYFLETHALVYGPKPKPGTVPPVKVTKLDLEAGNG